MAGKMMELAIAIKGKVESSLGSSTKQAAGSINELASKLAQLQKIQSKADAWVKQAQAVRSLSVQMRQAKTNLEQASQAMHASGSSSGDAAIAYGQARREVERLSKALTQGRDKLAKMSDGLQQSGFDSKNFAENYRRVQAEVNKTNGQLARPKAINAARNNRDDANARLTNANVNFGYAVGYAATLAAPIVEATQEAMKFESVMADVRKVVDFDTPQQFKEMSADVLALSQRLPMSAEGIAQIVAAGGQSGIARDELLAFAESAAKMGIAFDVTAEQAGDMMAKWRTAFHMEQGDVIDLADKINYLGNTTAASAPLISDVVTRIGPLGEIGGVASGEIAALGASMVGTGVQSEVAATGIKNLILGMTAGEGATKSQAAAFAALGMDATEMASRMQTDAKGAILSVMEALQALPKEQQATVLSDLFGKESIGAIAPLLSNLDALKDNFNKVADATQYAGSMEAEYQARAATTENGLQLTKNSLNALAINVGSALLPALNSALTAIAPVAAGFASWAEKNPELVTALVAIAGAVAGIVVAVLGFNVVMAVIGSFIANIKLLNTVFGIASKATAIFNAALALNPAIAIAMAIIALIGVLVYLWNTNDAFREAVLSAWETITTGINAAITAIGDFFFNLIVRAGELYNGVANWLFQLPTACVEAGAEFVNGAVAWASEAYDSIMEWIQKLPSAISDTIGNAWEGIKAKFSGGFSIGVQAAANANGGIYGRGAFLTTFAEESPEAAIPIDGSQRALDLWAQTGSMLGVSPVGGDSSFVFAPQITVQGAGQDTAQTVANVLDMKMREFESMMRRHQSNQRRLAYE